MIPPEALEPYRVRHQLTASLKTLFARAEEAHNGLDFDRAEQVYNTLLLINSKDIISLDRLSQVYLKQARFDDAFNMANRCLEIDPFYSPALHHLAIISLYRGEYKRSIRYAKTLIESGRAYDQTYIALLHALYSLSQFDNVIAISQLAKATDNPHPQFHFMPLLIEALKTPIQAKEILSPFFEKYRKDSQIGLYEYIQSVCFQDPAHRTSNLNKLEAGLKKDPIHAYLFLSLALKEIGLVSKREDLVKEAIALTKLAISKAPKFILPYHVLLELLARNNDLESILNYSTKGLEASPSFLYFLERQGESAFFLDQKKLALTALRKAIESESQKPDLIGILAILEIEEGNNLEYGLQHADKALTLDPDNPYAQTALGLYYQAQGEPLRAKIPLSRAIQKPIPITQPYELLIQILRRSGEWREALKVAQTASNIILDESIYIHVSEILYHLQNFRECSDFCQSAIKKFSRNKTFPLLASKSLKNLGKPEDALNVLNILEPGPSNNEEVNVLYLELLLSLKDSDPDIETKARAFLDSLLANNPRNIAYKSMEATLLYKMGKYSEALKTYNSLVTLSGSKKWLTDIGWVKFLLKQKSAAIKDLEIGSLQGNEMSRALALYRLGLIYSLTLNKKVESTTNYTKASELAPRLQKAEEDHLLFIEMSRSQEDRAILERNLKLYLQ